jgi:hypothetical protein
MNQVLQSGQVTPAHIATWTTDGVIQDGGVAIPNINSELVSTVLGINFNATNTDFPIPINLPAGFTRWRCRLAIITGASGTLTTATCGLFTQAAAAGFPIISTGTAITVNTNLADTNNNSQTFTPNDINTIVFNDTTVFFRVQTPQGNAATANVSVFYEPLP